jgi:hypothetical protein
MSKKRFILGIAAVMMLSVGIVGLTAGVALANSGTIAASEDCESFSVTVTLSHNVSPSHIVDVLTTIPGTTGFTGKHFDTSFGVIWTASGPAPASGTVTLNIYQPVNGVPVLEFTRSASISPPDNCSSPTPTSPTPTPTPSPTKSPHKTPPPDSEGPSVEAFTGGTAFTGGSFTGTFVAVLAFVMLGLGILLVARKRWGLDEEALGSPKDLY